MVTKFLTSLTAVLAVSSISMAAAQYGESNAQPGTCEYKRDQWVSQAQRALDDVMKHAGADQAAYIRSLEAILYDWSPGLVPVRNYEEVQTAIGQVADTACL